MIANHYSILGVSSTASEAEIKAAFKQLAKKYHPDKNSGNPAAEENFKRINSAYQVLSDKNKRARYDYILSYQAQKKQASSTYQPRPNPSKNTHRPTTNTRVNNNTPNKKNIKYTIWVVIAFVLFGTVVLFFSRYMNKITAKERLQEAIALEKNYKIFMAFEYYSQAIDYDPSLIEAHTRRAWLRFNFLKDTSGAKSDFESATEHSPKPDYRLYFEIAKFNFKIKKYLEGIANLEVAINLNPSFDSLYLYKGEALNYKTKSFDAAIKAYDKTLELNKNMIEALFGRAIAKQNSDKQIEALKDFNQLIQLAPDNGAYYYYRSWSKRNLNDNEGACQDLSKAIELGFMEATKEYDSLCNQ